MKIPPSIRNSAAAIAFIALAYIAPAQAGADITLAPGSTFYLDFPELGITWRDQPARAGVYLPDNYSPDKTFPLLTWYGGGAGGDNPGKAAEITAGLGFVCVALPYQPETEDGSTGGWKTPWSYYKTIFDKLEATVPNIDPQRRVCGGFSSGGAAVLHQIGNSGGAFQTYFRAFLPGGAGWPMGGFPSIKGRPMLAFMGDKDKRFPNYQTLEKEALAAEIDFQFLVFKDTGHKLSTDYFPHMREWLTKNVLNPKP